MGRYGNLTIKKVDLAESVEVKALILIQYFPIYYISGTRVRISALALNNLRQTYL